MSANRNIDRVCLVILALTLLVTVAFMNGERLGLRVRTNAETDALFSDKDMDGIWDSADATRIDLSSREIAGNGAYWKGDRLYIVYAGDYVLTGELSGGIVVDADGDDKLRLLLSGVAVSGENAPALLIEQADKVFLTLAEGTENRFSAAPTGEEDGAIFSRDDLTVNGAGSLTVSAETGHGIVCNDELRITGGEISVTAETDAIHVHDAFRFTAASLAISCGDDGVTVSNDEGTGTLSVLSGRIVIDGCYEGLEAQSSIDISGGDIDICASDDGMNSTERSSSINISGGTVRIVNTDGRDADGLDSNGSIRITGGSLFISMNGGGSNTALDCGSENGGELCIDGGTVVACGGSGMAELPSAGEQSCVAWGLGSSAETLVLTDASGQTLLSETLDAPYTFAIVSTPALTEGGEYTLAAGEETQSFTVAEAVTMLGNIGFGGMGGFGGAPGMNGERPGDFRNEMPEDFDMKKEPPEGFDREPPGGFDGRAFPGDPPQKR